MSTSSFSSQTPSKASLSSAIRLRAPASRHLRTVLVIFVGVVGCAAFAAREAEFMQTVASSMNQDVQTTIQLQVVTADQRKIELQQKAAAQLADAHAAAMDKLHAGQ